MATETVTISMGQGRAVGVRAETAYLGTDTGPAGSRNVERYAVTVTRDGRTFELEGTWDGDARHNTVVARCPRELRDLLLPTLRAQEAARGREDEAAGRAAERKFYGRELPR
jgi:hypothetical protein